jgi:hypothetical protein
MPFSAETLGALLRNHRLTSLALALGFALLLPPPGLKAENFRKLKDAEIKARLASMEITDGVHWAEQYMRDGTFKAFHMGNASKGKWHARDGELCLEDGTPDFGCKEVWLSGSKIEFRVKGSGLPPIEGVLQRQQPRQ